MDYIYNSDFLEWTTITAELTSRIGEHNSGEIIPFENFNFTYLQQF